MSSEKDKDHAKMLECFKAAKEEQVLYIDALKTRQDSSRKYYQLIVSIGYLGFLAIWSGIHTELSTTIKITSAALMTTSALIFIIAELCETYCAVYRCNEITDHTEEISKARRKDDWKKYQAIRAERALRESEDNIICNKVNWFVFVSSATTGVLAGVLLVVGLIEHFFNLSAILPHFLQLPCG